MDVVLSLEIQHRVIELYLKETMGLITASEVAQNKQKKKMTLPVYKKAGW